MKSKRFFLIFLIVCLGWSIPIQADVLLVDKDRNKTYNLETELDRLIGDLNKLSKNLEVREELNEAKVSDPVSRYLKVGAYRENDSEVVVTIKKPKKISSVWVEVQLQAEEGAVVAKDGFIMREDTLTFKMEAKGVLDVFIYVDGVLNDMGEVVE